MRCCGKSSNVVQYLAESPIATLGTSLPPGEREKFRLLSYCPFPEQGIFITALALLLLAFSELYFQLNLK